jgi:hypothetical protein
MNLKLRELSANLIGDQPERKKGEVGLCRAFHVAVMRLLSAHDGLSPGSVVSDRIKSYFRFFLRLIFGRDFPGQAAWAF